MGRIKNVLFVVNPISGAIEKTDLIKQVRNHIKELGASLFIYQTTGKEDCANIEKRVKDLKPCRIVVAGGDGTIKAVAEALKGEEIPVGIIPAGSANGLAVNLNLSTDVDKQLDIAFGDSLRKIDIISIDGEICLHMSDFGLNAELIKKYEDSNVRGKFGYLLQSIPTLVQSNYPFHFKIETNNTTFNTEGILLAIANAKSYGTGATVNPQGKIDDGFFEILIFKNFDFIEILKTLRNEVVLDPDFVEIISTQKATISCDSPVAFQIDGEYMGEKNKIEVSISPHYLLLAAPVPVAKKY